jgi:hypothetical protein
VHIISAPTDLIGDIVTAAAARGIDLDSEQIRAEMTPTALNLDDVREHLQSLDPASRSGPIPTAVTYRCG